MRGLTGLTPLGGGGDFNSSMPGCVCPKGHGSFFGLRDWSFTGRGGLQNGKIAGPKLFVPPPQDRVKLLAPPLLKSGNFTRPPYNMAKTSSYHVKCTPKLFVAPPPSELLKLFPPPLFVGVKLHVPPPLPFCSPPSP